MESRAIRIKLKPDALERVRSWLQEISMLKTEALSTLRDETVILECFWLEHAADGNYLNLRYDR